MKTLRLLLVLALLLLPSFAWAAAYTSNVASGNWNVAATWTPEGVPGTGDTATIAAGHEITIPAGVSVLTTVLFLDATTGDHSKLTINGTLTLEADTNLLDYNELIVGADGTFDLGAHNVLQGLTGFVKYGWIAATGTAGHFATITSTAAGGAFTKNWGGNIYYLDMNLQYCTLKNLGDCTFGYGPAATQDMLLNHVVAYNNGHLHLCDNGGSSESDIIVSNSDFRASSGWDKYLLDVYSGSTPTTGTYAVQNCTFQDGGQREMFRCVRGCTISNIVLSGVALARINTAQNMSGSFVWQTTDSPLEMTGGIVDTGNYYYTYRDNPHLMNPVGGATASQILSGVIEVGAKAGYSDDGDLLCCKTGASSITVSGMVLLDNSDVDGPSAVLLNSGGQANTGTILVENNTIYARGIDAYGILARTEGDPCGTWALATFRNNLVVRKGAAGTGRGINMCEATADQVGYTDYNDFYNIADLYYQVAITDLTEGVSTGFGLHDLAVDPAFYDPTRNLATWSTAKGGAGTAADVLAKFLLINGYDSGTQTQVAGNESGYLASDAVAWVRAGYVPIGATLDNTGYGSGNIGAIEPQQYPVLSAIGNQEGVDGELLTFDADATDPDTDGIIYTGSNLPGDSSINSSTGVFTWASAVEGTYAGVVITATDNGTPNLADSETITITVVAGNEAPVLAAIGNQSVAEGSELAFEVTATDPDDDPLTITCDGCPEGVFTDNGDGTADISWTPDYDASVSSPYAWTFEVSDSALVDSEEISVTVSDTNRAPVLAAIGNKDTDEGELLEFVVSATDPDLDELTYSADSLPTGATLNASTGAFSWWPGYAQSGEYVITFTATDPGELSDSEEITITVVGADITMTSGFESGTLGAEAQGDDALTDAFSATTLSAARSHDGLRSCRIVWPAPTGQTDLQGVAYKWTESGTADEWYLEAAAGGDPGLSDQQALAYLSVNGGIHNRGLVGWLGTGTWGWGDNDTLGYSTVYVQSATDPNGQAAGYYTWIYGCDTGWAKCGGTYTLPEHLPPNTELWMRAYVYLVPGFIQPSNPGSKFLRFHKAKGDGTTWGMASIIINGGTIANEGKPLADCEYAGADCENPSSVDDYSDTALTVGQWVCMEQYLKFTAGNDSVQRVWMDGILVAENTGFQAICEANGYLDTIYLRTWWNYGCPRGQVEFWDDVVITTATPESLDAADNPMIGTTAGTPRAASGVARMLPILF